MLKDVFGIHLHGKCFKSPVDVPLFKDQNNLVSRISLIYGRNGSGKSTICSGFKNLANDFCESKTSSIAPYFESYLINNKLEKVEINPDEKIFVFDEDYIVKNIKISKGGLGSIVLLGEMISNQEDLDALSVQKEQLDLDLSEVRKDLADYHSGGNKCPETKIEDIREKAKEFLDQNDFSLTKLKRTPITKQLIIDKLSKEPSKSEMDLLKEKKDLEEILEKTRKGSKVYPNPIRDIAINEEIDKNILDLLQKRIEKKELHGIASDLIETIREKDTSSLEKTKEIFEDESIEICPYCYQKIAKAHRESIILIIDSILNKEFNSHKNELLAIRLNEITNDYQAFSDIERDVVDNINIKKNECNKIINEYNEKIDQKLSSIYDPLISINLDLKGHIEELNKEIASLEARRQEIESSRLKKESFIAEYNDVLYGICFHRFNSDYIAYKKLLLDKADLVRKQKRLETDLHTNRAQETKLLSERENRSIAIDYINNTLSYIFYDSNRLTLTAGGNGNYLLKSRGREVEPKEVSIGERNAIALCYFFSKISEHCDRSNLFSNKSLIVLDDPISSFDLGNKMGIISYINHSLAKIMSGNQESKILLLTHDLASAYAFLDSISLIINKKYASTSLELKNNTFLEFYKRKGEYEKLLTDVFKFAKGDNADNVQYIGNAMRRIIEAFSTFVYNKGFRYIFYDEDILSKLGVKRNYFNGLSTALILNQRSHSEEQVKALMDNGNLLEYMEADEIRSTAKDVICLLYALNENHVKSYITKESDREEIQEWLSNLTKRSPCF